MLTLNGCTAQSVTVDGVTEDTIRSFESATGGSDNETLTGDASVNVLSGGDGGDRLDGVGGADTMIGGAGNDTYVIGAGGTIVESSGLGTYTVQSASTSTLANHFENLILTGTAAINGHR